MRYGSTGALVLLCCWIPGGACREDWTEFRGPTGPGNATATGLPIHWG